MISPEENHDHTSVAGCGKDGPAIRELLTRIGDKWSMLIILCISQRPQQRARFSELERIVPDISQRMLSLTLKNLEKDGMVKREVFAEVPPRVEYELTDLGRSLFVPLQGLFDWVGVNWAEVQVARGRFEEKLKGGAN